MKYGRSRKLKTNPSLRLAKTARRISCRRFFVMNWTTKKKDRISGRASKRSLKNFAKQELLESMHDILDEIFFYNYRSHFAQQLSELREKEWEEGNLQPRRINGLTNTLSPRERRQLNNIRR